MLRKKVENALDLLNECHVVENHQARRCKTVAINYQVLFIFLKLVDLLLPVFEFSDGWYLLFVLHFPVSLKLVMNPY